MDKIKKINTVAVISALGLGSIILTGCQEPQVLGPREIIPAYKDEVVVPELDTSLNSLPVNNFDNPSTLTPKIDTVDDMPKPMEPRKTGTQGIGVNSNSSNASATSGKAIEYTVKKNDSLWKIARAHGTGYITLAKYNNLSTKAMLKPGQKIMIPSSAEAKSMRNKKLPTTTVKSGVKSSKSSTRKYQSIPKGGSYTVKSGDSLWVIARRYGVKIAELAAANNIKKNAVLKVGQKLVIPNRNTTVKVNSTSAAVETPKKISTTPKESGDLDLPSSGGNKKTSSENIGDDIGDLPTDTSTDVVDGDVDTNVEITEKDMTVEELSKATGVSVEQLLKLNDGIRKFKKDEMYYVPKK
ncbi:LysM peptidoglycan-binding domain-containing protein [Lentisphaerota bacterium WC36G]|nr:LysM peptidoglycan-binding domain-containing protein [Lentisphaerae bacterium WC36]